MSLIRSILWAAVLVTCAAFVCAAQDKTTGAIKGKVRVERGSAGGVAVILMKDDQEILRGATDKRGDFTLSHIAPGTYSVKFRKAGLSVGTVDDVTVRAGQTRPLGDRLYLTVDEGSIAFIRGSVFSEDGRSVPGVRVDLTRVNGASVQKLDSRMTGETGEFVFRVPPDAGKYRVLLKADGAEAAVKDVEVEMAAVYRVALAYKKKP
ncbi:MAG TPA: carboxypeptidase-like regulatory domain-containing protein [Pyrinomonadaceae bacterium]|nr:carboxypeptidase-like regulatory domain-containing protein [Pyrinomonadaceae bacterium]